MAQGSKSIEQEDVLIRNKQEENVSENPSLGVDEKVPEVIPETETFVEPVSETLEKEPQEQRIEEKKEDVKKDIPLQGSSIVASDVSVTVPEKTYSETYLALKSILDDNLESYLVNLPEDKLQAVRMEQEQVLHKLEKMVNSFVIKTKEVLDLIRKWLKFIPGLNNFFLIQDAKIKTERVIELSQKKQKEQLPT